MIIHIGINSIDLVTSTFFEVMKDTSDILRNATIITSMKYVKIKLFPMDNLQASCKFLKVWKFTFLYYFR